MKLNRGRERKRRRRRGRRRRRRRRRRRIISQPQSSITTFITMVNATVIRVNPAAKSDSTTRVALAISSHAARKMRQLPTQPTVKPFILVSRARCARRPNPRPTHMKKMDTFIYIRINNPCVLISSSSTTITTTTGGGRVISARLQYPKQCHE